MSIFWTVAMTPVVSTARLSAESMTPHSPQCLDFYLFTQCVNLSVIKSSLIAAV